MPLARTSARFGALHHREPPLDDLGVRRVAVPRVAEAVGRADLLHEIHRLDERLHDGRVGLAVRRRRR